MRTQSLICIALFFAAIYAPAQPSRHTIRNIDFSKADSIAENFTRARFDNVELLTDSLCANVHTEAEKFRVIFRWVTNSLKYRKGREAEDVAELLKKKKTQGEGYLVLLTEMCEAVDIPTETVTGYARTQSGSSIPTKMNRPNHTWNAVQLEGEWYLVDVMWAAGTLNASGTRFTKEFNDSWFLTEPGLFMHTHYPENPTWFLTDPIIEKSVFKQGPILMEQGYMVGMQLSKPKKALFRSKFKVEFTTEKPVHWASILFENSRDAQGLIMVKKGPSTYRIEYKFHKQQMGGFYLILDGTPAMCFKRDTIL